VARTTDDMLIRPQRQHVFVTRVLQEGLRLKLTTRRLRSKRT
jgi:hypothetical protein